jgi:hypothetical protein
VVEVPHLHVLQQVEARSERSFAQESVHFAMINEAFSCIHLLLFESFQVNVLFQHALSPHQPIILGLLAIVQLFLYAKVLIVPLSQCSSSRLPLRQLEY